MNPKRAIHLDYARRGADSPPSCASAVVGAAFVSLVVFVLLELVLLCTPIPPVWSLLVALVSIVIARRTYVALLRFW